jgi:hypothetical protein
VKGELLLLGDPQKKNKIIRDVSSNDRDDKITSTTFVMI